MGDLVELFSSPGWLIALIVFAFIVGRMRERRHIRSIEKREAGNRDIVLDNRKSVTAPDEVVHAQLVMGQVVIATDYFKSFVAGLKSLVGGELTTLESLMMRARREAILRMIEEARQLGATEVWNVRMEFCNINEQQGRSAAAQVEVVAFGTAVVRRAA